MGRHDFDLDRERTCVLELLEIAIQLDGLVERLADGTEIRPRREVRYEPDMTDDRYTFSSERSDHADAGRRVDRTRSLVECVECGADRFGRTGDRPMRDSALDEAASGRGGDRREVRSDVGADDVDACLSARRSLLGRHHMHLSQLANTAVLN